MKVSGKEENKARYEREIFTTCTEVAKLNVEADSVKSEKPPRPDISCIISGHRHYFELTEIVDEELAEVESPNSKTVKTGCAFSHDVPLLTTFSKKAQKAYHNLGGSLELLAYYEKQPTPNNRILQSSTKVDLYYMTQDMIYLGPWFRLWIYDIGKKKVLGRWARD
jgi:hypothetical protein